MGASLGQVRDRILRWYAEGVMPFTSDPDDSEGILMEQKTPAGDVFSSSLQWGGELHLIDEFHHFFPNGSLTDRLLAQRSWAFEEPENGGLAMATTEVGFSSRGKMLEPTTRLLELRGSSEDSLDGLHLISMITMDGTHTVAYFPQEGEAGKYVFDNGEAEVVVLSETRSDHTVFMIEGEPPEWSELNGVKWLYQKKYAPNRIGIVIYNDQDEMVSAVMVTYDENGEICEIEDQTQEDESFVHTFTNSAETF